MKYKIIIVFTLLILIISCTSNSLYTNEIALELVKLENDGKIEQSDMKEAFFRFLDEIYLKFENYGFGHRITEMKPTWNLYEDETYLIMTGSVAKSDSDIYMFTILFENKGNGIFDIIYEEVGQIKFGTYPTSIIPYEI